jgi:hypothetical protein
MTVYNGNRFLLTDDASWSWEAAGHDAFLDGSPVAWKENPGKKPTSEISLRSYSQWRCAFRGEHISRM